MGLAPKNYFVNVYLVRCLAEPNIFAIALRSHVENLGAYALRNLNATAFAKVSVDPSRGLTIEIVPHALIRQCPVEITLTELALEQHHKIVQTLFQKTGYKIKIVFGTIIVFGTNRDTLSLNDWKTLRI